MQSLIRHPIPPLKTREHYRDSVSFSEILEQIQYYQENNEESPKSLRSQLIIFLSIMKLNGVVMDKFLNDKIFLQDQLAKLHQKIKNYRDHYFSEMDWNDEKAKYYLNRGLRLKIINDDVSLNLRLEIASEDEKVIKSLERFLGKDVGNYPWTGDFNKMIEVFRSNFYTRQCLNYNIPIKKCLNGAVKYDHLDVLDKVIEIIHDQKEGWMKNNLIESAAILTRFKYPGRYLFLEQIQVNDSSLFYQALKDADLDTIKSIWERIPIQNRSHLINHNFLVMINADTDEKIMLWILSVTNDKRSFYCFMVRNSIRNDIHSMKSFAKFYRMFLDILYSASYTKDEKKYFLEQAIVECMNQANELLFRLFSRIYKNMFGEFSYYVGFHQNTSSRFDFIVCLRDEFMVTFNRPIEYEKVIKGFFYVGGEKSTWSENNHSLEERIISQMDFLLTLAFREEIIPSHEYIMAGMLYVPCVRVFRWFFTKIASMDLVFCFDNLIEYMDIIDFNQMRYISNLLNAYHIMTSPVENIETVIVKKLTHGDLIVPFDDVLNEIDRIARGIDYVKFKKMIDHKIDSDKLADEFREPIYDWIESKTLPNPILRLIDD